MVFHGTERFRPTPLLADCMYAMGVTNPCKQNINIQFCIVISRDSRGSHTLTIGGIEQTAMLADLAGHGNWLQCLNNVVLAVRVGMVAPGFCEDTGSHRQTTYQEHA